MNAEHLDAILETFFGADTGEIKLIIEETFTSINDNFSEWPRDWLDAGTLVDDKLADSCGGFAEWLGVGWDDEPSVIKIKTRDWQAIVHLFLFATEASQAKAATEGADGFLRFDGIDWEVVSIEVSA